MQNWDLRALALGCTSKLFPIHREVLGFLILALGGPLSFSQFLIKMENWVFWKQVWTALLNFSQFTKELGNWDFWSPPYIPHPIFEAFLLQQKYALGTRLTNQQRLLLNWFHSFRSSQFFSISNVVALVWVCRTNYILELYDIFLSEDWISGISKVLLVLSCVLELKWCYF